MSATLVVGATLSTTATQLTAFAYQKEKVGGSSVFHWSS
jgi:hypothetical protein